MKNLITASACAALLMAFLIQFVHLQVMYQQMVMTNYVVDLYQEKNNQEWLQDEISQIMGCNRKDVEIRRFPDGYQVRFPMKDYIASPKFWGIEEKDTNGVYVIERRLEEKED